jgi:hypothetical protein
MNAAQISSLEKVLRRIECDGFAVLNGVFDSGQVDVMLAGMANISNGVTNEAIRRSSGGAVCAARNVLALWPKVADVWRQPPLPDMFELVLGQDFGLVRVLFFDKPNSRSWTLPWHRDVTIAVRDNSLSSSVFGKPTRKAGVPHVEAPRSVLEQMIALRIHLDDTDGENGGLKVRPGSHRQNGENVGTPSELICAQRGDVLIMRPLLIHSSGHVRPGTSRSRRIIHFEFAASPRLQDGYEWHDFHPRRPAIEAN